MQMIYRTALSPEQYVEQNHWRQVRAPQQCGFCLEVHCLEALAYYGRYVTGASAEVLRIWVRRFICRLCRRTTSCLPEFALPYRLVNAPTVADGFERRSTVQVARWGDSIRRYWRSFNLFLDELTRSVGNAFGPLPLRPTAAGFWGILLRRFGSLGAAMEELVHRFGITLFARYRCHQRPPLRAA